MAKEDDSSALLWARVWYIIWYCVQLGGWLIFMSGGWKFVVNSPLYIGNEYVPHFILAIAGGLHLLFAFVLPCVPSRGFAHICQYFNLMCGFVAGAVLDFGSHQFGAWRYTNQNNFYVIPSWCGACTDTVASVYNYNGNAPNPYAGGSATNGPFTGNLNNVCCIELATMIIGVAIYLGASLLLTWPTTYFQKRTNIGSRNNLLLWGLFIGWAGWLCFIVGYGDFVRRNNNFIRPPATKALFRNSIYVSHNINIPVGAVFLLVATRHYFNPHDRVITYLTALLQYAWMGTTGAYLDHTSRILASGFKTQFNPGYNYNSLAQFPYTGTYYKAAYGDYQRPFIGFPIVSLFPQEAQRVRLILSGACISAIAIYFFYYFAFCRSISTGPAVAGLKNPQVYWDASTGEWATTFPANDYQGPYQG